MIKGLAAAGALALLAGCQTVPTEAPRASAQLQPTKGNKAIGEVIFEQVGDKVRMVAFADRLPGDREFGFHIHEVGDCSNDGNAAKGHFNPFGKPHGRFDSPERHAGDLPPLRSNKAGRAKLDTELDIVTLRPGPSNIIGKAIIVHADPDDFTTQPTGNAGARIACGVIQPG
jgi:superoxide dismutase, Cu-Zn family